MLHVAPVFHVADLKRSMAYYQQLGFTVQFSYEDAYAGLVRDACHLHLRHGTPRRHTGNASDPGERIDACFMVRDAGRLADEMASRGVTFAVPLRSMPYGTEFYIDDPDGYTLAFVEATPTP